MQQRRIIMEMRTSGSLKGVKPCMIYLKKNLGKIYDGNFSYFVMSIHKSTLYFQKITRFLQKLSPKGDFEIDLKTITKYAFLKRKYFNVLCLYDTSKRFIEINFNNVMTPDTFPTQDNISRIIKVLEESGISEKKF